MCIFIGCWPWSIKRHHVSRLVFLFSCPKNPSINHLNFYCRKQNRLHFSVCVYCTQDATACKAQQSRHSTSSRVVLFCFSHAVTSSVIYYSTHTWKNVIYLLNKQLTTYFILDANLMIKSLWWNCIDCFEVHLKVPMKRKLSLSYLKEVLKWQSNIFCSFWFSWFVFEIFQFVWYAN